MNKQTVGYSESAEMYNPLTGLKKWIKVWHEIELDRDEDKDAAFNDVQSFVQNKFHKDNNPQLTDDKVMTRPNLGGELTYQTFPPIFQSQPISRDTWEHTTPTNIPIPTIDPYARDRVEILIDDAKTFDELERLYEEVKKYGLEEVYAIKYQTLQF